MSRILDELNEAQAQVLQGKIEPKRFPINEPLSNNQNSRSLQSKSSSLFSIFKSRLLIALCIVSFISGIVFSYNHWPRVNWSQLNIFIPLQQKLVSPKKQFIEYKHKEAMKSFEGKQYAEAISIWSELLALNPDQPALATYLARAYKFNQNNKSAYSLLLSFAKSYPNDIAIQNNLAAIEIENHMHEQAIARLNLLKITNPNNADVIFNLATAYELEQKWPLALETYNEFLKIAPTDNYSAQVRARRKKLKALSGMRLPAAGAI